MELEDLVGKKFGKLLVVSKSDKTDRRGRYWNVICDCGTKKVLYTSNLKKRKSCGCITSQRMREKSSTYQSREQQRQNALEANKKTIRDGINFGILNGRDFKNNTSGHRGIYWDKTS